jgi:hypothetical protein
MGGDVGPILLIGSLLGLIAIGTPVAYALGISSLNCRSRRSC